MAKAKPAKPAAKAKKPAPKAKAKKPAAVAKKPVAKKPASVAKKKVSKPAKSSSNASKPDKPSKPGKILKLVKRVGPKAGAAPKASKTNHVEPPAPTRPVKPLKPVVLTPFLKKQQERLLQLRDSLLDAMAGVAKDNLRSRAEGSEASAFGMHQADAGSDAYDRDFALSLLSQEQDALYEIDEALKRVELGTYGTCEMSGKAIAHARLEALPFARYTVECQSQLEKQSKVSRARVPVTSLFGLTDEEPGEKEDEEEPVTNNDKE
jgi:RNA polymerase-binding transcription factor DksA